MDMFITHDIKEPLQASDKEHKTKKKFTGLPQIRYKIIALSLK